MSIGIDLITRGQSRRAHWDGVAAAILRDLAGGRAQAARRHRSGAGFAESCRKHGMRDTTHPSDEAQRNELRAAFMSWVDQFRTDLGISIPFRYLVTIGHRP